MSDKSDIRMISELTLVRTGSIGSLPVWASLRENQLPSSFAYLAAGSTFLWAPVVSGGSSGTLEEEGSEAQPGTRILPGWLFRGHSDQVWICVGERDCSYLALGRPKLVGECHMGLMSQCACLAWPSQCSLHFPLGFLVSRLRRSLPGTPAQLPVWGWWRASLGSICVFALKRAPCSTSWQLVAWGHGLTNCLKWALIRAKELLRIFSTECAARRFSSESSSPLQQIWRRHFQSRCFSWRLESEV